MSDFILWLHANYIRPQIDAAEKSEYAFHFDLVKNDLPPSMAENMNRILEFTAIQAFSLGRRTGEGLTSLPGASL